MGTAIMKHPVPPDQAKPAICNFGHPGTLTLRAECQKLQMTGLTWSGTGCFIAVVPIWQQWASKGYRTAVSDCMRTLCTGVAHIISLYVATQTDRP